MSSKTDGRGRIYLPADIREEFGDEYRIVKLPNRVTLLPVDEDPLEGLHEAVGDAFDDVDHEELEADALDAVAENLEDEASERAERSGE